MCMKKEEKDMVASKSQIQEDNRLEQGESVISPAEDHHPQMKDIHLMGGESWVGDQGREGKIVGDQEIREKIVGDQETEGKIVGDQERGGKKVGDQGL